MKSVLLFLILFYSKIVVAQIEFSKITFKINKIDSLKYNNTKIFITLKDTIISGNISTPIIIKKNITSLIQFENFQINIPSIKNLKILSDTILELSSTILDDVIIKSKKNIVSETLNGFNYFPQNDSIYFDKSLLLALQRLPNITIDNQSIKYKDEKKIKFLINNRERKGIGNNWASVLQNIKASDIYKVEMFEDISILDKNQGYNVIINIRTLDENISGTSLTLALMYDQRNNLNQSLSLKNLHKKSDLSVELDNQSDNLIRNQSIKIFRFNSLFNENNLKENYKYSNQFTEINFGYRLDSFKNLAFSFSYSLYNGNNFYTSTNNGANSYNSINNKRRILSFSKNFSYIDNKNKNLIKSLTVGFNFDNEEIENKIGFSNILKYDSINNQINARPFYFITEFNLQNNYNKKNIKEYGIQFYKKQNFQDFSKYDLNEIDNQNNNLFLYKKDSFKLSQSSIRPYFSLNKTINTKKRLILNFYSEVFFTSNKNSFLKVFFCRKSISIIRKS